jgi:hypothetical protein
MPHLPAELHRTIVEELDRSTIFQLLLVSHHFRAEGERRIYQTVLLRGTQTAIEDVCGWLLVNPRLLPYVLRLTIEEPLWAVQNNMVFHKRLSAILAEVSNLIALKILNHRVRSSWHSCGTIFRRTRFKLQYLLCPFGHDDNFTLFLENQPTISRFNGVSSFLPVSRGISTTILPDLTVLELGTGATPDAVGQLTAGWPITHLS